MTHSEIEQIDVTTAAAEAEKGATLLDVREQHEWDAGHAPVAEHMALSSFDASQLPSGRILAICHSGARSSQFVSALAPAGYDVVNVTGGMVAWADAGLPLTTSGPHADDEPTMD